jgi:hypothetical protein
MTAKIKGLSKIYILSAVYASTILFLVSCGQMGTIEYGTTDGAETTAVGIVSDSVLVPTYYELTQLSDIVLIGHVRSEVGVINTARNHTDNSQPDPRFFTVAVVYAVEVEEYLVGEGPRIIYLTQWEGSINHGTTPSPAEIEQARVASENELYTSLDSSKRYLMFLRSIEVWDDYDIAGLEKGNLFVRTANPWLFDATDQMSVFVLDVLSGIEQAYPALSLAEIVEQMKDPAMTPLTVPYPAPGESPLEQFQPTVPSSYPAP